MPFMRLWPAADCGTRLSALSSGLTFVPLLSLRREKGASLVITQESGFIQFYLVLKK